MRNIRTWHLQAVIDLNDIIETTEGKHSARRVYLGKVEGRPIHVVLDVDPDETVYTIVTVYEPKKELWMNGYRERRKS